MVDDQQDVTTAEPQAPEVIAGAECPAPSASGEGFATLVVKRGGAETDIEFPINPPAVIGRFDPAVGPIDVDLASLPEGSYVSRKHAKITCESGDWMIQDLGSSNGTFILGDNFERVEMAELSDGKEIALGNARFVFHLRKEPEAILESAVDEQSLTPGL